MNHNEVKHFIRHYCGLVIFKLAIAYEMGRDPFRKVWWKLWGFNPDKDPNFHLSQISFDKAMVKRMVIVGSPYFLAKAFYGSEAAAVNSKSVQLMNRLQNRVYLRYEPWKEMADFWDCERPGQLIIDWFCKNEGISERGFNHKLKISQEFKEAVQKTLDLEFP